MIINSERNTQYRRKTELKNDLQSPKNKKDDLLLQLSRTSEFGGYLKKRKDVSSPNDAKKTDKINYLK